jgi:ketosteroid isomerase-like protein
MNPFSRVPVPAPASASVPVPVSASASASAPVRTPAEVFAQVQRRVLAFDGAGYASLFARDAVVEFPFGSAPGVPTRLAGREQIRRHIGARMEAAIAAGRRMLAYQNLILHQTADPEVLIAEFEVEGEVVCSDRHYHLPYVQVYRIRDGLILEMRDYVAAHRIAEVVVTTSA